MSYNVTMEVLDEFSTRLHINTALNLGINIPAMYFIIFYSTKAMGSYKYYLLYSVVNTFVMDLHQSVVYGVYFFPLAFTTCCSGICRYFRLTEGARVNHIIMSVNTSVAGIGLISLAGYRYYSIRKELKWFESKFTLPRVFLIGLTYPTPMVIVLVIAIFAPSQTKASDFINTEYSEFSSFVKLGICSSFRDQRIRYFYTGITIVQMGLVQSVGFILVFKTTNIFKSIKQSFSTTIYAAHKQFLLSMWLQFLISMCALILPLSVVMSLGMFKIRSSGFVSEVLVHTMTLRAPLNGLTIILMIKPYRDALKKLIMFKSSTPPIQVIQATNIDSGLL